MGSLKALATQQTGKVEERAKLEIYLCLVFRHIIQHSK